MGVNGAGSVNPMGLEHLTEMGCHRRRYPMMHEQYRSAYIRPVRYLSSAVANVR